MRRNSARVGDSVRALNRVRPSTRAGSRMTRAAGHQVSFQTGNNQTMKLSRDLPATLRRTVTAESRSPDASRGRSVSRRDSFLKSATQGEPPTSSGAPPVVGLGGSPVRLPQEQHSLNKIAGHGVRATGSRGPNGRLARPVKLSSILSVRHAVSE